MMPRPRPLSRTDFLYSSPSFLSGAASVLDIGATFTRFNTSATGEEADARAMWSDWAVVGQDLIEAAKNVKKRVVR